jgi:hypothetical protein
MNNYMAAIKQSQVVDYQTKDGRQDRYKLSAQEAERLRRSVEPHAGGAFNHASPILAAPRTAPAGS